jgi:integrase
MNITKQSIESLQVPEKGFKAYFDVKLSGFLVRVYKSGAISFWCYYYTRGKKRWVKLGRFGKLTVDEARSLARQTLAEASLGRDPLQDKRDRQRKLLTFGDLADKYWETHGQKNSRQTQSDYSFFLNELLLPKLRHRELINIDRSDLEKIAINYKMSKSKRTDKQISGARANRLISLISRLFNLAVQWKWLDVTPATGMEKFKEVKRERVATADECKRIYHSILDEEDPFYRSYFQILWLTMARRGEIQKMKWEDLDLKEGIYRMKETKAGRPFTIPLPEDGIKILKKTPRRGSNPYVFAGESEKKPINGIGKAWERIRERAKVNDLWIHDIRRTGGSNMIMSGASLQDVAQVLNHSNLSTTQRYAQLAQNHKKMLMESHGNRLREVLKDKVVSFEDAKEALRGS